MNDERDGLPSDLLMVHRFMGAVAVLHERGYHRVRWLSGMSPSGMHLRVTIGRDTEVGRSLRDVRGFDLLVTTSSGAWDGREWLFAGATITTEWTAEQILQALPPTSRDADDPAYADCFRGLLELCVRERTVPIAFADDLADRSESWEIGWGGPISYPAPPV